jgi:hypothetical protein
VWSQQMSLLGSVDLRMWSLLIRGLLMGCAPLRFCFEGSLCYIIRIEVGPLLCEPVFKHWCLLLPTPNNSSLFDTELDLVSRTSSYRSDHKWATPAFAWVCQMSSSVSSTWLPDAICGECVKSPSRHYRAHAHLCQSCQPGTTLYSTSFLDTM